MEQEWPAPLADAFCVGRTGIQYVVFVINKQHWFEIRVRVSYNLSKFKIKTGLITLK